VLFVTLGCTVVALAPLVAGFYAEPAMVAVIAALASRFLFLGLVNVGIADFDRNLDFGRDLRMRVGARLVSFAATLAAAVILRSYWALVIGLVVQSAAFAAASWLAHPYRPRLSLARRRELLGVSAWMFLNFSAQVVHHQLERLAIGRFGPMSLVGLYSVSKDLSSIFTQEIATALNRVTFVATAHARPFHETPERAATILGAYAMIAAPFGIGLAAVAEDAVAVLLGPQWLGAAPLLQLIAPASALYAVYKVVASSLQAAGLERRAALLTCAGTAAAAAAIAVAALASGEAAAIALASLGATSALLAAGLVAMARLAGVRLGVFVTAVGRPFAAAAAMFVAVRLGNPDTGVAAVDLGCGMLLGALVYPAAVMLLWFAARRPAGAEAHLTELAVSLIRRFDLFQWRRASRRI
jgi:O-antigen/teichoic acid export membrane protein